MTDYQNLSEQEHRAYEEEAERRGLIGPRQPQVGEIWCTPRGLAVIMEAYPNTEHWTVFEQPDVMSGPATYREGEVAKWSFLCHLTAVPEMIDALEEGELYLSDEVESSMKYGDWMSYRREEPLLRMFSTVLEAAKGGE